MNIILRTDSYKLTHWKQYPKTVTHVHSYLESRIGAQFDKTVFFGLQPILDSIQRMTVADVEEARELAKAHFGTDEHFNRAGWEHIEEDHDGKLPLEIKAVAEGTPVPSSNVLMTVENTCPQCFWLTNAMESLLTHIWYPSTVASLAYSLKGMFTDFLLQTGCSLDGLPFMLHDFGYRGVSSDESAAIGGAAHLTSFQGTDTILGMLLAQRCYKADPATLAYSVPATEHSVMTARGRRGEMDVVGQLLEEYPKGILSVVIDSYNPYAFVEELGKRFKRKILDRDGVFVIRPDSTTSTHKTPEALVVHLSMMVQRIFGSTGNSKNFQVLDPHVRLLWGDGIDRDGIQKILQATSSAGFASCNYVFGMGGGLLQKVNRDTQRFAFKASAMKAGDWYNVQKIPLDCSKMSKTGRLALTKTDGIYETVQDQNLGLAENILQTVFLNGEIVKRYTFDEVRKNTLS